MKKRIFFLLVLILTLVLPTSALAQNYYFELTDKIVHVYWNEDGTSAIDYVYIFQNDPSGHTIEFVDVPMPNNSWDVSNVQADVDNHAITYISSSEYQGDGSGFALGLENYSIPPGGKGKVHVFISGVRNVLYPDDNDKEYASANFAPNTFNSSIIYGKTNISVTFHLPPGVQPEEPRWHQAPVGFNAEPITGFDDTGRITYTWSNDQANGYTSYNFGASFPAHYVPEDTIVRSNPFTWLNNINPEAIFSCFCVLLFLVPAGLSIYTSSRRKLQYLPPKIAIEGHGIKRGLTAVEASILLEQPLDKILTMILFSTIKKNAAEVISRDPLKIKISDPLPASLQEYEREFLHAFEQGGNERKRDLQAMVINLVTSLAAKMKGFSRKETIAYYKDIIERAWKQVEADHTPEVRSEKYDEVMEWTMLDRDYDKRTRDIFRTQPVYVPVWWGRYDPTFSRGSIPQASTTSRPTAGSSGGLPHLPGSDFAASMVNGVQSFSSKVVGNISDFTSGVTQKTNPVPVSTSSGSRGSSRSGGSSCACACACAGCACACAGGGR